MKVAMLCSFPIYDYAADLGIDPKAFQRITSWNENLAKGLARIAGLEVHVITAAKAILRTQTVRRGDLSVTFYVSPPKSNLATCFQYMRWTLHRLLRDIQPDIVHGIGTEHIWPYIAITSPFPSVVTVHGVMSEIVRKIPTPRISQKRFFAWLERKVLRRTQHLIAVTPYIEEILGRYVNASIYPVENAVSERFFDVQALPWRSERILFVGNTHPGKNLLELVEAFLMIEQDYPKVSLSVIGPISQSDYYHRITQRLGDLLENRVVFRGFLLPHELAEEYRKAAFLVLPSLQETAPMCVAEAMCCGLPVVATKVGGVEYMVRDGDTGLLIQSGDIKGLSQALQKLLASPHLRESMGKKARLEAQSRFHPDMVARKTYATYKRVIGEMRSI